MKKFLTQGICLILFGFIVTSIINNQSQAEDKKKSDASSIKKKRTIPNAPEKKKAERQRKSWRSGIKWEKPAMVETADVMLQKAPSDAIVLFDGKDLSTFDGAENWVVKDGYAMAKKQGIYSRQAFGDCQLHLEYMAPDHEFNTKRKKQKGNSGIKMMGFYEVQIFDSKTYGTIYEGQNGAIYKQHPPLVNACKDPGKWQSYDIIFRAPRFNEDGTVKEKARITVLHNGVLIQNNYEIQGTTAWHKAPEYEYHAEKLPFYIQYHGSEVKFRNIWIREVKSIADKKTDGSTITN